MGPVGVFFIFLLKMLCIGIYYYPAVQCPLSFIASLKKENPNDKFLYHTLSKEHKRTGNEASHRLNIAFAPYVIIIIII